MTTLYPTATLNDAAKLLSGGTPRKSNPEYWGGSIPWLTPKDMTNWQCTTENSVTEKVIGNGTRLAPARTSFIAVRGMSLHNEIRVIHSETRLAFNQDIKAVVAADGVLPKFLYYALIAAKPQLLEWVSAAGHGTGVMETDRLLSVPVPKLGTHQQQEIAAFLSALDDKIELNRRMNETLEALAQAIFKDWFVTFGPTRRKIEGATDPVAILGGLIQDAPAEVGTGSVSGASTTNAPTKAAPLAALFPCP
ncbi:MAG: restriction endonuclease subunit S, partial [Rhizobiales bacterium]|nr:restriction endonuclease subunit S [Hyphomicrobiales bacterium]